MYYVVNLETRAVLTHKGGSRIIEANEVLATSTAEEAQKWNCQAHAIVSIAQSGVDALGREVAPWFRK